MALADLITPRINELGKIKIGAKGEERKSQRGGTYRNPVKLDHFVVTTLQRDAAGDLIPDSALMASLAPHADADGKLRQLPVALLSNEIEDVLQAGYVWYHGKRAAGRSDGVTLTTHYDRRAGAWLEQPRESEWKPEYADLADERGVPLFKLHVTLNVVVAAPNARWGGYYKFRSTSGISASQLYGGLLHVKQLTGGVLRGLPLMLVLRPVQVSPGGKTTTVHVVHLELRGADLTAIQTQALDRARFKLAHRQQMHQAETEYRRLLAPPGLHGERDEADAAAEFHPEAQPDAAVDGAATPPPVAAPSAADPLAARLTQPAPPADPLAPQRERLRKLRHDLAVEDAEWQAVALNLSVPADAAQMGADDLAAALAYFDAELRESEEGEQSERQAIEAEAH